MKYSIVLPVRNGGHYIKECVASILGQSVQDLDCIILDNCSTDGTREWVESLGDPRIRMYPSDRPLSIEENWARIRDVPRNTYMTMIGHDDVLGADYLAEMDRLIALHPDAGLYQTHFSYIDQDGGFIRHCQPMDERQGAGEFLAAQMARIIDSTGTGYLMRSSDFDREGGFPVQYPNLIFSDYALWIALMRGRYKATSARDCFSYRLHQSVSRTTDGKTYQDAFARYVRYLVGIRGEDPAIRAVVERYGRDFLLYYCESMAHRLLKNPPGKRTMPVKELIQSYVEFAALLVPGQDFEPMRQPRTKAAVWIDSNGLSRWLFRFAKKVK